MLLHGDLHESDAIYETVGHRFFYIVVFKVSELHNDYYFYNELNIRHFFVNYKGDRDVILID